MMVVAGGRLTSTLDGDVPAPALDAAKESVGAAYGVAGQVGGAPGQVQRAPRRIGERVRQVRAGAGGDREPGDDRGAARHATQNQ